jgi:hypothetical protein
MNGKINKGKGISLGRSHSKTGVAEATNAVAAIAEESHKLHSWEYVNSLTKVKKNGICISPW